MTHFSRFNAVRRFSLALALASVALFSAPLLAQDQPDIKTEKNSVGGVVNTNGAPIHSGPTENSYITLKLNKGDKVTVVGAKFDWLKIIPPEGSYCCVGKLFVDRHGDGDGHEGRINKQVNIRAGSDYSAMCSAILCQAAEGTEVNILGEQNEYFKIKPPEGAYVYINKQYVDHDAATTPPAQEQSQQIAAGQSQDQTAGFQTQTQQTQTHTDSAAPEKPETMASAPTTNPSELTSSGVAVANPPATQPDKNTAEAAESLFAQAESDYAATTAQPVEQQTTQSLQPLIASYTALTANDKLPDSLVRVAEEHLANLQARAEALTKLAEVRKQQEELQHHEQSLVAESKELEERLAKTGVTIYTAVGELQPSSLQFSGATLYRLTDPATGRSFCYVRTNDSSVVRSVGQFVGINGDLANDAQLNSQVIALKNIAAVEAAKVNNGVVAQLVPPSMMVKTQANSQQ